MGRMNIWRDSTVSISHEHFIEVFDTALALLEAGGEPKKKLLERTNNRMDKLLEEYYGLYSEFDEETRDLTEMYAKDYLSDATVERLEALLRKIAHCFPDGSHIEMKTEDDCFWMWVFRGGKMFEFTGEIVYSQNKEEVEMDNKKPDVSSDKSVGKWFQNTTAVPAQPDNNKDWTDKKTGPSDIIYRYLAPTASGRMIMVQDHGGLARWVNPGEAKMEPVVALSAVEPLVKAAEDVIHAYNSAKVGPDQVRGLIKALSPFCKNTES